MNKNGFSLLELVVVVAILGILFSMAAISGKQWMDKYRVEGQTEEMYVDLMNARASAMQKNRMHFATLEAGQYAVYQDTNPSPQGNGTLETGSDRMVMQKNVYSSSAISSAATRIDFDSRGLVTAGAGDIFLEPSFGAVYNCIQVSSTRIRMGGKNGSTCETK